MQVSENMTYHCLGALNQLLREPAYSFDATLKERLPKQMGYYRILYRADDWQTVYVGKSDNLRRRVYQYHYKGSKHNSTLRRKLLATGQYSDEAAVTAFLEEHCHIQFIPYEDEITLRWIEHFSIAMLQPEFNS